MTFELKSITSYSLTHFSLEYKRIKYLSGQIVARVRQVSKLTEPRYQLHDDGQRHVGPRIRVVGQPVEHRYGNIRDADGSQQDGRHEVYAVSATHATRHQPSDSPVFASQLHDDISLATVLVDVGVIGVKIVAGGSDST